MQCSNCGNQVPNHANVCGFCGTQLRVQPSQGGLPGWAWGCGGASLAVLILGVLGVAAYFLFFIAAPPSAPAAPPQVIQPAEPPLAQPEPQQPDPEPQPTSTPRPTAVPPPEVDFCQVFEGIDMSIVYLDWKPGAPLTFYIKMPGGVPQLEKVVPEATDEWRYSATVGEQETDSCEFIEGYKERLYCSIDLSSGYGNSVRPLSVEVDVCDDPVFEKQSAYLPEIEKPPVSGGSSCGSAPPGGPNGCTAQYMNWCACMKGMYTCGFGGPICLIP